MRVQFGAFLIDSETRELRRGDAPVTLSPKAFDLLSILVAERPRAIAKSELLDRLWPATFVVEKNLANLVSEIRDAIGDHPSNPQFIRTVHRFGYAFREPPADASVRSTREGEPAFHLQWVSGRVTVHEGEHVLGRDPDADVLLPSPGVSRRHALLSVLAGSATISDLGSKNGTFVGDHRLNAPHTLCDGDIISVGSVKLTFKVLQAPHSTETQRMEAPKRDT